MNHTKKKRILLLITACILVATTVIFPSTVQAKPSKLQVGDFGQTRDTMSDTWVAIDDLGREVTTGDEVDEPDKEKHVLMFYYTWNMPQHVGFINNITEILAKGEETGRYRWGDKWSFHYWGEPYFGYYRSDDPWVIRKDIQMLTDAGVDGLFFDAGNGVLYHDAYEAIFREILKRKADGQAYVKCTFMLRAGASDAMDELYETYYSKEEYKDVFYEVDGKPLILMNPEKTNIAYKDEFTIRDCWAWNSGEGKWPWLEDSPQIGGWAPGGSSSSLEMVSVAAAQHPTTNIGKSNSNNTQPGESKQQPELGIYFSEQWERALELDPQFVLVTQWNEWIAQRFIMGEDSQTPIQQGTRIVRDKGDTYFVDVLSMEYSRDISPMRGGYGDNYYYLLTSYIRQFKGARDIPVYSEKLTVNIGDFATISTQGSPFYDDLYDTLHRNHPASGAKAKITYVDETGRNDFEEVRVTSDDQNLYFYVRTVEDITAPEGTNWMNLLINSDSDYSTGWHGYDYVVNRNYNGNTTSIESYGANGEYTFTAAGEAQISYNGKEMMIIVPKALINVSGDVFSVDFKFADNVPEEDDIMLFIDKGDVAPNNRFNYRYKFDINANASKATSPLLLVIIIAAAAVIITAVVAVIILKKKPGVNPGKQ